MEKLLEKLFDLNKIPTKLILVIWLCASLVLFVPAHFLKKLNLTDFLSDYGKYIGISFLISTSFLLVTLCTYCRKIILRTKIRKEIAARVKIDLHHLDYHEKALLREFFLNNKHAALQLPMDNDTVVGLVNKKILYQASNTGFTYAHGIYLTHSITDIARDHLTLEMIDLPQNPTKQQVNQLIEARPQWAKERSRMENIFRSF